MTYAQLVTFIVTWIKENHNREITGNILQDVLLQLSAYVKDSDDGIDLSIENLQEQIDNITINAGVRRFLGVEDPNITPPTDVYDAGDLYVNTSNDRVYIFTGSEWFYVNRESAVNAIVREIAIDEELTKSEVVDYLNDMPPFHKMPNDTIVVSENSGNKYLLIGVGSGFMGVGGIQVSENNLIDFGATFDPSDYDLNDFNNESADPFVRESDVPIPTLQQVTEQGNITDKEIIHSKIHGGSIPAELKAIIGSESRVVDEGGGVAYILRTPFLKLLINDIEQVKFDFRGLNFTTAFQDYTQYTRYGEKGIHIEREFDDDSPTYYRNILIPTEIVNENNFLPLTVNGNPADNTGNISITNPIIIVITPLGEVLETGDVEYAFTAPYDFNLTTYWISAQVAPIGSGITVRLKVNGTYTDSNGTTIPTGAYDSIAQQPLFLVNVTKGDRITAEITAVGSTYEGEGLTLYLEHFIQPIELLP